MQPTGKWTEHIIRRLLIWSVLAYVDDGEMRLLVYLNVGSLFSCMHEHVLTKRKKIIKLGKSRGNYSVLYLAADLLPHTYFLFNASLALLF